MTEQPNNPQASQGPVLRGRMVKRIGIGAALVALPVGTVGLALKLQDAETRSNGKIEENLAYDTAGVFNIDPALVKYKQVSKIQTGMESPVCMTMGPKGQILVGADRLVRVFDGKGMVQRNITIGGTPTCVTMSKDGAVYVGMKDHVEVYGADGAKTAAWASLGEKAYITSISVGPSDVFVADAGGRVVHRCGMDGKVAGDIGKEDKDRNIPGLVVPSEHLDVVALEDGCVWVTNPGRHQLEKYTRDGDLLKSWGKGGNASVEQFFGCCNPSKFALLSDGRIVTAEKGVPRVKVYQADGTFESIVAGPDAFGANRAGLGVAADADGRILVLEPGTRDVRVYERL